MEPQNGRVSYLLDFKIEHDQLRLCKADDQLMASRKQTSQLLPENIPHTGIVVRLETQSKFDFYFCDNMVSGML